MANITCPQCLQRLKIADDSVGKKIKCAKCSAVFVAHLHAFLECIAEAAVAQGLRGLTESIPGATPIADIADQAWRRYQDCRPRPELHRDDIKGLLKLAANDLIEMARNIARRVSASKPELCRPIELYLEQVPACIRQALKRKDDPGGQSLPASFMLTNVDDVVRFLPPTLPRFRSGDPLPGKMGWILDRQLGVGGFGEVWLARHPKFHSLSGAVKFCRNLENRDRDMLHESKVIDRLLSEGGHDNIVKLLDVQLDGESPWLMYEYVDAGDLADQVHQWANLSKAERQKNALVAMYELAQTIGYFHRLNPAIVHRDLKPANTLRDTLGRLRVTDFGISGIAARQIIEIDSHGGGTRAGRLLSCLYGSYTPLYASPQQRDGEDPDPRDDVHALCVIAYQMLTGQLNQGVGPDFEDDLRDAGVSDGFIAILRRCTAQKAERRPKDAGEVADALKELLTPVAPPPPPEPVYIPPPPPPPVYKPPVFTPPIDRYEDIRKEQDDLRFGWTVDQFLKTKATSRINRWYEAAQQGFVVGQYLYGLCLNYGTGIKQDLAQAAQWLKKAADQNHPDAQNRLGVMYQEGKGVAVNFELAANLYRMSAEQGNLDGQFNLAMLYRTGRGVPANDAMAIAWLRKVADQNDAQAQNYLGWMYSQGLGGPVNDREAAVWYRKSADNGYAMAMNNIGALHRDGRGVAQDDIQALAWFRRAAEKGNPDGQCNLGWMYENARGVSKNMAEAVALYRKSAEQGYAWAQYNLGRCYDKGEGLSVDHQQAAHWYQLAAKQNIALAINNLGALYQVGKGVPLDERKALELYRQAADLGEPMALHNVGFMYDKGIGVARDRDQALIWYKKAADKGNELAKKAVKRIENPGFWRRLFG